jgi:ABC-type transporter Mla subunit MlaD
MSDDVFRIVVTVAVAVGCLAIVVQAFVVLALARAIRSMQQKFEPVLERAQPAIEQIPPTIARIEETLQKAGPVIEKIGPLLERVGAAVDNVTPLAKSTGEVLSNTNKILVDLRPKVSEMAEEAVGIAKSGREGVERVGEFLRDAGDRAHTRLEQIDRTVENTVGQVDQVGEVVKRAVMAPVREVNGLAAGISAAVSTLVSRPRRPSVDEATQDEEMFI